MRDFACPSCGQRLAFENSVYPFALPPRVLDKVAFVHRLVTQARAEVAAAS